MLHAGVYLVADNRLLTRVADFSQAVGARDRWDKCQVITPGISRFKVNNWN